MASRLKQNIQFHLSTLKERNQIKTGSYTWMNTWNVEARRGREKNENGKNSHSTIIETREIIHPNLIIRSINLTTHDGKKKSWNHNSQRPKWQLCRHVRKIFYILQRTTETHVDTFHRRTCYYHHNLGQDRTRAAHQLTDGRSSLKTLYSHHWIFEIPYTSSTPFNPFLKTQYITIDKCSETVIIHERLNSYFETEWMHVIQHTRRH